MKLSEMSVGFETDKEASPVKFSQIEGEQRSSIKLSQVDQPSDNALEDTLTARKKQLEEQQKQTYAKEAEIKKAEQQKQQIENDPKNWSSNRVAKETPQPKTIQEKAQKDAVLAIKKDQEKKATEKLLPPDLQKPKLEIGPAPKFANIPGSEAFTKVIRDISEIGTRFMSGQMRGITLGGTDALPKNLFTRIPVSDEEAKKSPELKKFQIADQAGEFTGFLIPAATVGSGLAAVGVIDAAANAFGTGAIIGANRAAVSLLSSGKFGKSMSLPEIFQYVGEQAGTDALTFLALEEGGIYAKKFLPHLFKNITKETKPLWEMIVDKDVLSKLQQADPAINEFFKEFGVSGNRDIMKKILAGGKYKFIVPESVVTTISDRPWFKQFKELFGLKENPLSVSKEVKGEKSITPLDGKTEPIEIKPEKAKKPLKLSEIEGGATSTAPGEIAPETGGETGKTTEKGGPQEIVESGGPVGKAIMDSSKELVHLFAPRVGVNRDALDKIMEMKGHRDKIEFELEQKWLKVEDMFEKLPKDQQIKFVDDVKLGNKQPTPELQKVADIMREVEDKFFAEVQKFKPGLSYLDNHFRVFWNQPDSGKVGNVFRTMFRRPLEGTKGFMRAHVFKDMSEGIKLGLEPVSYNPVTMWRNHIMDMQKFITASRMFAAVKDMDFLKFVKPGGHAPEDFSKLDDKIAKVYFPAEIKYSPEGEAYTVPHLIGEYYIEKNVGRILNNFLSKDWIRASELGNSLLAFKNITTAFELSLSPFHASYESGAAVASQIGLGYQKIWRGDFAGGLVDILTSGLAPKKSASLGGSVIKYVKNPAEFLKETRGASFIKQFPDAAQLINDAFTGGMKFAIHQDYKINAIKAMKEGLKNKEYGPVILHAIPAGNELIMKPLFEIFIPRLKLGTFFTEMSEALVQHKAQLRSGEITRPELARRIVDSVENRFGEMNFDNLFWNRTFKSSLQLFIRSVTWKVGAIKNVTAAIPGQIKEIMSAIKGGRKPILESNFAYLLGIATLVTAFSMVIQKLYVNEWPKDFKDLMAPRYDKDGNRIMLNTHLKDWIHIAHSPINFLSTSSAGYIGRVIQLWQNKDFYGTEIVHEDDPPAKKAWAVAKQMIGQPFVISSTIRAEELKSPTPLTVATMAGITQPAPKYIGQSKAEALAIDIQRSNMPQGSRTQVSADRSQLKANLRKEYAKNKSSVPLSQAVVSGKITQKEKDRLLKDSKLNTLERTIKTGRFTIQQVAKVYKVATPEERKILLPILKKKIKTKLDKPENLLPSEEKEDQDLYKKYFGQRYYG
jgi:hypothetical protein